jgi:hypothetical protein
MRTKFFSAAAAATVLATSTASVYAQQQMAAQQRAQQTHSAHVTAMANLERAAQRMREAIQTLAQQVPGEGRNTAIREGNSALADAQSAMAALGPPAPRIAPARRPADRRPASYDEAMQKLRRASDRLYDAVHALARVPAGERRNAAIEQVNEALIETQAALAWAADEKFTSAGSTAVGATHSRAGGTVAGSP